MENNDQSHNGDPDDQPRGMHVDPCAPSSSQELVAEAAFKAEFPLEFTPGFTFTPTDDELILYYLKPKVMGDPIPLGDFFADVDLYKFDPGRLIENRKGAGKDGDEWYFFTPRERKCPNGSRPNRCTPSGVWKATGKDSIIRMENKTIGYKKLLAFFRGMSEGRSRGSALNMHEYRLEEAEDENHTSSDRKKGEKDKKLDEWVLCKVYTPKHAKHSKNGWISDHPPNGNNGDSPVHDGYLQDLQSTPNRELNASQQVDVVNNYGLPESPHVSAPGGPETSQPACNVLPYRSHTHPDFTALLPAGMWIGMPLQVQRMVTQPASLEPPIGQLTGNSRRESSPSRSSCLPPQSTSQNPGRAAVYNFNDLMSINPYNPSPHQR